MKAASRWTSSAVAASVALGFLSNLASTSAHSWLECTDYRFAPGSTDARVWNPSLCQGRARCGRKQMDVSFGVDTGFNAHTSTKCQCERDDAENQGARKAPVASYTPGQRVCLAYPPKNHVADKACTNEFVPDAGVRITRTAVNPTSDDPSAFLKDYEQNNGKHVNGQVDYKGFQNCPNFCQDKEHALCTMCFDLENDIAPGEYTFKWVWSFNSVDDAYTTCWEASVGLNAAGGGSGVGMDDSNGKDGENGDGGENERSTEGSPSVTPSPTATPSPVSSPTPVASAAPTSSDEFGPDCEDELEMPEPLSSSSGGEVGAEEDCEDELDMAESSEDGGDCDDELEIPDTSQSPSRTGNGTGNEGEVGGEGEYEPADEQGTGAQSSEAEGGEDPGCSLGLPIAGASSAPRSESVHGDRTQPPAPQPVDESKTAGAQSNTNTQMHHHNGHQGQPGFRHGKSENDHDHNAPQSQEPHPTTPATEIGAESNDYTEGAEVGGEANGGVKGTESEDDSDCQNGLPIANAPGENPGSQHSESGHAPQGSEAYASETTTTSQVGAEANSGTESENTGGVVDLVMSNQGSAAGESGDEYDGTLDEDVTSTPSATPDPNASGDDEDDCTNASPLPYAYGSKGSGADEKTPEPTTPVARGDAGDHGHDHPHAYSFNNGADYNGGVVHPEHNKQTL
ncbi:hypothetical protein FI667_g6057, partial [Globisporangium splendens]